MIQNSLPEPPCSHQPRWREELDRLPQFSAELRSPSRRFRLTDFTEENKEHWHNFCTIIKVKVKKTRRESEIYRAFLDKKQKKQRQTKSVGILMFSINHRTELKIALD